MPATALATPGGTPLSGVPMHDCQPATAHRGA